MMNHPLSRMLINAFVDSLEIKNLLSPKRGLFGNKKFLSQLKGITETLGWGDVQLQTYSVSNSAHPLLSVALAQYALETYHIQRYKVRWTEPRIQTVQLEVEPSNQLPSPKAHNKFPWSDGPLPSQGKSPGVEFESRNSNELRIEGERVIVIPTRAIERFLMTCLPYAKREIVDWFNHEIDSFSEYEILLQTFVESVSEMFLHSERPVYIIDQSSWTSYIDHYLTKRGWGAVQILAYDADSLSLEVGLKLGANFPFTVGIICGMWQRAHGRAFKVRLKKDRDCFHAIIESLLEYQNQS